MHIIFVIICFSMGNKYLIVEFEDGVQIIPSNWADANQVQAFWPHFKSHIKYNMAVRNLLQPGADWQKCDILRVLYSTGVYIIRSLKKIVFVFII